jgi:two-component SAPR family response regulator
MKIIICSNERDLSKLLAEFLQEEVEYFETFKINNNLIDNIYKINPDLIFF